MRKVLKSIIKVGILLALIYGLGPFLTVLGIGYASLKAVDVFSGVVDYFRNRKAANANVSSEQVARNRQRHKINSRKPFFDWSRNEWNLNEFPLDMYPTLGVKGKSAEFTCAGIPNIVHVEAIGRNKAEFSMILKDEYRAKMIMDHITNNAIIGTRVERIFNPEDNNYIFKVVSDNAVDINEIVHEFYPQQKFEVSRRIEETKQFIIDGCSSYEEAVEKFKSNRHHYIDKEINTVTVIQNTVNDVKDNPVQINEYMDFQQLEAGQYVINETSWKVYSKNVVINGDMDRTEEDLRSVAAEEFETRAENLVEDQCSAEPVITNALEGKKVQSVLLTLDSQMALIREDSPELDDAGKYMVMRFSSEEDMRVVLDNPASLVNKPVLLDSFSVYSTDEYVPKEGEYIVTVPMNKELFNSLVVKSREADLLYASYKDSGVTRQEVNLSYMVDRLERNGYVTAYLKDVPDFSQAKINGMAVDQFESLSQENIEKQLYTEDMTEQQKRERKELWMREMSQIKSVDMSVDLKTKEVIFNIEVINQDKSVTTKTETRSLNMEELEIMMKREDVTELKLKDLVLKAYPSFFLTYSTNGQPVFVDPVGDFINKREPKTVKQLEIEKKQARKEEMQKRKDEKQTKKINNNKMKI